MNLAEGSAGSTREGSIILVANSLPIASRGSGISSGRRSSSSIQSRRRSLRVRTISSSSSSSNSHVGSLGGSPGSLSSGRVG